MRVLQALRGLIGSSTRQLDKPTKPTPVPYEPHIPFTRSFVPWAPPLTIPASVWHAVYGDSTAEVTRDNGLVD